MQAERGARGGRGRRPGRGRPGGDRHSERPGAAAAVARGGGGDGGGRRGRGRGFRGARGGRGGGGAPRGSRREPGGRGAGTSAPVEDDSDAETYGEENDEQGNYSKRKIVSNWDRYQDIEKEVNNESGESQRGTDFSVLLSSADGVLLCRPGWSAVVYSLKSRSNLCLLSSSDSSASASQVAGIIGAPPHPTNFLYFGFTMLARLISNS
ncbi:cell death regulator Aven isoform X3 [Macaca fascicularis]|uniref:cell death regulator Aven isoform X3 n=1 Tax=Macaca fascicularis TaxID=9541 RepID=UPI003D15E0AA